MKIADNARHRHLNRFVRWFVPIKSAYSFSLKLDGQNSRSGVDWLECSTAVGCKLVQAPSDTIPFLHPCNEDTNKIIKSSMQFIRDCISTQSSIDVSSIRIALMAGLFGYQSVTQRIATASLAKCGLYPME